MAHLQYMPGDPRLVDQLVYELKSKGIFDQFRKDCISDVDTRPAYQNLRQRVESSVALFLARQPWKPDLNKNQLREKLRKHILDGNYLEQGVERIVDQVVNPKVASVFIPQVEDLVYNYLGVTRKKAAPETSTEKGNTSSDLLPNDLEAVSPGSVKSNDDKDEPMDETKDMEIDEEKPQDLNDITMPSEADDKEADTQLSGISDLTSHDSENSLGKLSIPMPADDINLENIPSPENSPPKIDLDSIELPKEEPIELKDIPLPEDSPKDEKEQYFKPVNSEDESSSDSSIIRNMSPLTPIRNFNNENSCDAQQAFENDNDIKTEDQKEPNSFRFTIEAKSSENSSDNIKEPKVETKEEQTELAYQFNEQVNINTFNTPMFDDSSNSHNLQIDYESDVNSKTNLDKIPFPDDPNSEDSKKESTEEKKSHKSSRSRDSHRHSSSSSKDRKSDTKHSSSRDRKDSKHDRKSSKDDQSKSKSSSDKSKDRTDRKDSNSKHKSSSSKDSKHRSSSSSQRHSSSSKHDDRKSSSSTSKDKEKDKNSKDHKSSRDSKSRSGKDKKSKKDDKDKDKKDKKDDDHYSASGRGNVNRRSTDRDSNDGSSSSKGSHNQSNSKSSESKTNKGSKSDNTSPSSNSTTTTTSPSEKEIIPESSQANLSQYKPIVRVDTHLETPRATPPRLPFVPDVTLKKPRFAANLEEAKRLMKMRKFLDEEQKRMNQEAALLLEFQANVRPSLSQVYSSIPGPELEFACVSSVVESAKPMIETNYAEVQQVEEDTVPDSIEMELTEMNKETKQPVEETEIYESVEYKANFEDSEKLLNEISRKVYGVEERDDDKVEEMSQLELKPAEEVVMENIKNEQTAFEGMLVKEDWKESELDEPIADKNEEKQENVEDRPLQYFAEHEKYDAEMERIKFEQFLKEYLTIKIIDKLHLINCDTYEENIMKEVAETFGTYEIVNYHQNGHNKRNVVKNVNVANEIILPLDRHIQTPVTEIKSISSPVFSPVKSECSFELTSDYDAKLDEMVNKTSRQEIMEIILGGVVPDECPSEMPQIDYYMDDSLRADDLKRKLSVESTENNNGHILTPCKIRKLSESDQISSTTEETPEYDNRSNTVRSKYLGRARRVGLPRPRRTVHPNSPSSDKSVENYDTNDSEITPNGKIKTQRKVQRYDTSDLYKPKLHYLSRRNNIS